MGQPAARISDMHVCPMINPGPVPHVGGPVNNGVTNVLIGGMPAATMGCTCVCAVGPPDAIVKGSMSVMIGNRPAARMGDLTSHGGTITSGLPTVLIGDLSSAGAPTLTVCEIIAKIDRPPLTQEAAAEQHQLQKDLEIAARTNLNSVPPGQREEALAAVADYQKGVDATNKARLSQAVYGQTTYGACGNIPCGYQAADPAQTGITDDMLIDEDSGFKAAIYEGPDGEKIVSYAGTEDWADWKTNLAQGVGGESSQHNRAMEIATTLEESGGDIQYTGHSLGGGLASAANAVTGREATTFNAAGVHPDTPRIGDRKVTPEQIAARAENIDAYYNSADPLNAIQDSRKGVFAGAAIATGALAMKFLGPIAGTRAVRFFADMAASGDLPQAAGNRIEVPSDDFPNLLKAHGIDSMIELLEDQEQEKLEKIAELYGCPVP